MTAAQQESTQAAGDGSVRCHLLIDGLDGGDQHKGREGAFDFADFKFDIAATVARGGGPGKTTFRPIEISFQTGSSADELLKLIASNTSVGAVQIVGDIDRETSLRTFDLRLADVDLSRFHQGSDEVQITLRFDELSLTTSSVSDVGVGRKETYHFDVSTNTGDDEQLPAADPEI